MHMAALAGTCACTDVEKAMTEKHMALKRTVIEGFIQTSRNNIEKGLVQVMHAGLDLTLSQLRAV